MSIFNAIFSGVKSLGRGIGKGFQQLNQMGADSEGEGDQGEQSPWQKALGSFAQGFGRAEAQGGGLAMPQLNFANNNTNNSRGNLASAILNDLRTKHQSDAVATDAGIDPGGLTPRTEPLSPPASRPRFATTPELASSSSMALPFDSSPPYVGPYKTERMLETPAAPMGDTKIIPRAPLSLPDRGLSETEQINRDIAADKFGWGGDMLKSAEYDAKYGKMRREEGLTEDQINQPTGKQRLKEAILSGLTGAAMAGQQSRGDIGAMLGGFGVGAAGGAINPVAGRGLQFNVMEKPQLVAQEQHRQQQNAQLRQAIFDDAKMKGTLAEIALKEAQADKARRPDSPTPHWTQTDQGYVDLNDPANKGKTFNGPAKTSTPHWTLTDQGYVDLNDPANKGKNFRGPDKDITPSQQATIDRQEQGDATGLFQQWQKMRAAAMDGELDQGARDEALTQANNIAEQIHSRYPHLYEVGGDGGWSFVKPRQGQYVKRNAGKSSGNSSLNLRRSDMNKLYNFGH